MSTEKKIEDRILAIKHAQEKGDNPLLRSHLVAISAALNDFTGEVPEVAQEVFGSKDRDTIVALTKDYIKPISQTESPAPIGLACWGATLRAFHKKMSEEKAIYSSTVESNELDRAACDTGLIGEIGLENVKSLSQNHPLVLEMMVEKRSQNNPKLDAFREEVQKLKSEKKFDDVEKLDSLELKAHKILQEEYPRYIGVPENLVAKAVEFSKQATAKLYEKMAGSVLRDYRSEVLLKRPGSPRSLNQDQPKKIQL